MAFVGPFTYFSFDDYIYLHRAEDHASSLKTFFGPFWSFSPWLSYRPLPTMYWVVLFSLFGASPLPYELGVMLIFAGMVFFIYRTGRLLGGRLAGCISGALVALYFPIYSVSWSRWSSSLQMELFFLASAMFYLLRWAKQQSKEGEGHGLPVAGILLMVGAFLSKETSFLAPLLLPLIAPRKRVVKLSATLFLSGVGLFLLARGLIPSQFPLPAPRLELSIVIRNLEFFLRHQFMFYLTPSLVLMAALARGSKNRHVWLLAAAGTFFAMNSLVGYADTAHRIKLLVCVAALVYSFIKAPSRMRFALGWATLLILPPLSMLDTNVHQSAESFLGLSLFIGLGVSSQMELVRRLAVRTVRALGKRFTIDNLKISLSMALRSTGVLSCVFLALYGAYSVISLNLEIGGEEARRMVHVSNLTKTVREHLCTSVGRGVPIHSTNLPGLISVPDIPFDARLHGCELRVDEDMSASDGIFIIANDTTREILDAVASKAAPTSYIARGPYGVSIFTARN